MHMHAEQNIREEEETNLMLLVRMEALGIQNVLCRYTKCVWSSWKLSWKLSVSQVLGTHN